MKIELQSTSLKEIMKVVKSNNLNIEDVFIEGKIWEDISTCEEFIKFFLRVKGK